MRNSDRMSKALVGWGKCILRIEITGSLFPFRYKATGPNYPERATEMWENHEKTK